jgi:hypothetical protein
MDPSYVSSDDDDDADAMARFMGFSSFGNQGPTKKRKFNPATDAMVDGQELASIDKGGKRGQGSGGNDVPLGKQRVLGVSKPSANQDEIALDEDDDEDNQDGGAQIGEEDDEGPVYIDTSLPPPDLETRAAQERIDAIIGSTMASPAPGIAKSMKVQTSLPGRGISQYMAALHEPAALPSNHAPVPPVGTNERPRERGQRSEFWYLGYYDHGFNENPWAKLEAEKGLEAVGSWVERTARVS